MKGNLAGKILEGKESRRGTTSIGRSAKMHYRPLTTLLTFTTVNSFGCAQSWWGPDVDSTWWRLAFVTSCIAASISLFGVGFVSGCRWAKHHIDREISRRWSSYLREMIKRLVEERMNEHWSSGTITSQER